MIAVDKLMIGDWVSIKGKPCKVAVLRRGNEDVRTIGVESELGVLYYTEGYVEPIPISEEILVKNGFMKSESGYSITYEWSTGGIPQFYDVDVIVCQDKEKMWRWDLLQFRIHFWRGDYVSFCKKYVYELQNALRLCCMNELANKFKV